MKYNIYINYLGSCGLLDIDIEMPNVFSWRDSSPKISENLIETRVICKLLKDYHGKRLRQIYPIAKKQK